MHRFNRREFVRTGLAAGAAFALPASSLSARGANEQVNLGFISCGGRANDLMGKFSKIDGIRIAAMCDPDQQRLDAAKKRFPTATTSTDLKELLNNKRVHAVVVATCNHWHCLAAIWAMDAGKHVYVEKPLSHSQWEGRQAVAAAKKYNKICQVGTQQRSDPMQAQIKEFLHIKKGIGEIVSARVNRYGVRPPIGKRTSPLPIPDSVDYNLWLGPAQEKPIYRDNLHYDWHWDWNTGSGEMGNWGVHVLDDLRNNVFLDRVALPKRIFGGGGRVVFNDAGETPNVHFVYFDTGVVPVVIGLTNITDTPGSKKTPKHPGPASGYIAYCEGGRLEGQRGRATAFDRDNKVIKEFRGNSGSGLHQQNFIDAVRANDASILNSDVSVGHYSTGWCNLANVAFRAGRSYSPSDAQKVSDPLWKSLVEEMESLLKAHDIAMSGHEIKLSPMLQVDADKELFVGEHAESANGFLKRAYRKGFVVPEVA